MDMADPFYQKFKQHLQYYSTQPSHLEKIARAKSERDGEFLQKVNAHLLANLAREDFNLTALCKALAISRTQFYRRLTSLVNMTPTEYIRLVRLTRAMEHLETKDWTIAEVGFSVGFKDKSHFSRAFRKYFGINPSQYRQGKPSPAAQ